MKIRKTLPDGDNKYYLKKPGTPGKEQPNPKYNVGYNPCILGAKGNRPYPNSVLANCIGAGVGRFNELCSDTCQYLGNRNPGGMVALARSQGLETGTTPKPGAAAVFVKADGVNGHVMSIEAVNGDNITTFESGYHYKKGTYCKSRVVKASQNYGMNKLYGKPVFIYNPNVDPYPIPPADFDTYKTRSGDYVKFVQWVLVKEKCYLINSKSEIDGKAGSRTQKAVKKYQTKHGLKVDGWAGVQTVGLMKKDHAIL